MTEAHDHPLVYLMHAVCAPVKKSDTGVAKQEERKLTNKTVYKFNNKQAILKSGKKLITWLQDLNGQQIMENLLIQSAESPAHVPHLCY